MFLLRESVKTFNMDFKIWKLGYDNSKIISNRSFWKHLSTNFVKKLLSWRESVKKYADYAHIICESAKCKKKEDKEIMSHGWKHLSALEQVQSTHPISTNRVLAIRPYYRSRQYHESKVLHNTADLIRFSTVHLSLKIDYFYSTS